MYSYKDMSQRGSGLVFSDPLGPFLSHYDDVEMGDME